MKCRLISNDHWWNWCCLADFSYCRNCEYSPRYAVEQSSHTRKTCSTWVSVMIANRHQNMSTLMSLTYRETSLSHASVARLGNRNMFHRWQCLLWSRKRHWDERLYGLLHLDVKERLCGLLYLHLKERLCGLLHLHVKEQCHLSRADTWSCQTRPTQGGTWQCI